MNQLSVNRELVARLTGIFFQIFRATILESLTSIAGILSMIAEPSVEAQTPAPLAVSIALSLPILRS